MFFNDKNHRQYKAKVKPNLVTFPEIHEINVDIFFYPHHVPPGHFELFRMIAEEDLQPPADKKESLVSISRPPDLSKSPKLFTD